MMPGASEMRVLVRRGRRVRVNWIRRNCELEISGPLLTVDLTIMNRFEVDVILEMD